MIGVGTCPLEQQPFLMKRTKKKMLGPQDQAQYLLFLEVVPTPAVHNTLQCLHRKQIAVGLLPLVPREQSQPHLDAPTLPAN